jgi:hypothetical protein
VTWFKVDDTLCSHSKPRQAGLAAIGLWTVAGSWCGDQLSDGQVPEWYVASWPSGKRLARQLVAARLWHEPGHACPDCPAITEGYVFHDFHQANPTREEELAKKAKRAEAGRKGGLASGAGRAAGSSVGQADAEANASPSVEPRPDPSTTGSLRSPAPASAKGVRKTAAKAPDPIWDALLAVCQIDPSGVAKSARGAYNTAAADLRSLGATPSEISRRARQYRRQWPGVSLTPTALARRWAEIEHAAPPSSSAPPSANGGAVLAGLDARVAAERAHNPAGVAWANGAADLLGRVPP